MMLHQGFINNAQCALRMIWLVALLGTISVTPSVAAASASDPISRAETWLNKLKTLSADFIQVASDGTATSGKLYFRRPSRMKIIYGDGKDLTMITSPVWLHVDQPSDRSVTSYPIGETPLALILADTVTLRPEGYRTTALPSRAGIERIELEKAAGEGAGKLTLEFSQNPFSLRRWIIVDSAGIETSVMLQNTVFDKALPNQLFAVPSYDTGEK